MQMELAMCMKDPMISNRKTVVGTPMIQQESDEGYPLRIVMRKFQGRQVRPILQVLRNTDQRETNQTTPRDIIRR
jgi:hypothetical protein